MNVVEMEGVLERDGGCGREGKQTGEQDLTMEKQNMRRLLRGAGFHHGAVLQLPIGLDLGLRGGLGRWTS